MDVLVHGHQLSRRTAYSSAPQGAKLSDVQFGRHVDLCQTRRRKRKKHEKARKKEKKEKHEKQVRKRRENVRNLLQTNLSHDGLMTSVFQDSS